MSARGSLLIIGGSEDRRHDMTVLERFVAQCGGRRSKILVLTAASAVPGKIWTQYHAAFDALGASDHEHLQIDGRNDAGDPRIRERIDSADGIFISGGDQKRLLASTGGTLLHSAMHEALARGACIAGTSAGASAMSARMVAAGEARLQAIKGNMTLGQGYGFLESVIIDQHFSQRQRLPRLLSVVAQEPELVGVGIDEDTALLIEQGLAIEVLGDGAITMLDARQARSNMADIDEGDCIEMTSVRLHLLPSGSRYSLDSDGSNGAALSELLAMLTTIS